MSTADQRERDIKTALLAIADVAAAAREEGRQQEREHMRETLRGFMREKGLYDSLRCAPIRTA